jgi:hypothetical protein
MYHRYNSLNSIPAFSVFIFLLLNVPASNYAQVPFSIDLEDKMDQPWGKYVSVPVVKGSGSEEILAFDFRFGYNAEALTLFDVTPGELFDVPGDYEWKYFSYRIGIPENCGGNCPSGMVRIMARADTGNGEPEPATLNIPDGLTLFYLDFYITRHRSYRGHWVPVDFWWTDCHDNIIVFDPTENKTAISNNIFDSDGNNVTGLSAGFPSRFGAPDECLESEDIINPVRFADYSSGIVSILNPCAMVYPEGDINVNDATCEIADLVLFTNYFYDGLSVFQYLPELQVFETDMDHNGQPLSVNDYHLIRRIIDGFPIFPISM